MKEDILEQLVDDYLQTKGYFTRHNIKFRPRGDHPDFDKRLDSNHSDIDVIGVHPKKDGCERVMVVSCKSWQAGFKVTSKLNQLASNKIVSGREAWQAFRELMKPKWSEAFIKAVEETTGSQQFTYLLAVTAVRGERKRWEEHTPFKEALQGNPIRIIDLAEILQHFEEMSTTTVASSDIGRVLQLMKAAQKGKAELARAADAQGD
jgi:hypothetical protein